MKKLVIATATAALAVGALVGCTSQPSSESMTQTANEVDEYIAVCMDKDTQNRVDDENCKDEQTSSHYSPYFYSYGSMIPGIGYPMLGGYPTVYAPYYMGFSTTGGSSTNYQAKTPMAYPKGYVAPPNVVYKKSTPSSVPLKSADEAAAKYSTPRSNSTNSGSTSSTNSNSSTGSTSPTNSGSSTGSTSSANSGSSTDSKSSTTTKKSNPYSYKGKTSTSPKSSSRSKK